MLTARAAFPRIRIDAGDTGPDTAQAELHAKGEFLQGAAAAVGP